jgi:hypothetical protein
MAKSTVYDWSATAANNTDIGGIGITGANLPSNLDDAQREFMAQLASFFTQTGYTASGGVLYHRKNVLATVSQSAGVPTGGLIERGSNANGEYVRFADGTQICMSQTFSPFDINLADGNIFRGTDTTWTYPAAFTFVGASGGHATGSTTPWCKNRGGGTTSTIFNFGAASSRTGDTVRLWCAGRWFN